MSAGYDSIHSCAICSRRLASLETRSSLKRCRIAAKGVPIQKYQEFYVIELSLGNHPRAHDVVANLQLMSERVDPGSNHKQSLHFLRDVRPSTSAHIQGDACTATQEKDRSRQEWSREISALGSLQIIRLVLSARACGPSIGMAVF